MDIILLLFPFLIGIIIFFIMMTKAWKDLSFFPAFGGFLGIFMPGLYIAYIIGNFFSSLSRVILLMIVLLIIGLLILLPFRNWNNYLYAGLVLGILNILLLITYYNLLLIGLSSSF